VYIVWKWQQQSDGFICEVMPLKATTTKNAL